MASAEFLKKNATILHSQQDILSLHETWSVHTCYV